MSFSGISLGANHWDADLEVATRHFLFQSLVILSFPVLSSGKVSD